jgi:PAS domain-containing protein
MDSPIGAKGADNPPSAAAKPQGAARRASAEEILAKSEHRFWVAFENSMTGMLFDDLEGGALEVNDAFCDMVGRTRDELIGKDMG